MRRLKSSVASGRDFGRRLRRGRSHISSLHCETRVNPAVCSIPATCQNLPPNTHSPRKSESRPTAQHTANRWHSSERHGMRSKPRAAEARKEGEEAARVRDALIPRSATLARSPPSPHQTKTGKRSGAISCYSAFADNSSGRRTCNWGFSGPRCPRPDPHPRRRNCG